MNLNDITNDESPMVLVKGIGQMKLSQAKKRVQGMLEDLSGRVNDLVWSPDGRQQDWQQVDSLIKRGVLQAYVEAIVAATKQQH